MSFVTSHLNLFYPSLDKLFVIPKYQFGLLELNTIINQQPVTPVQTYSKDVTMKKRVAGNLFQILEDFQNCTP